MSDNHIKPTFSRNVQHMLMDQPKTNNPNPLNVFIDSGDKDRLEYYQKIIHQQQMQIQEQQKNINARLGVHVMQNQFDQIHITPQFQNQKPLIDMVSANNSNKSPVMNYDSFNNSVNNDIPQDLKLFLLQIGVEHQNQYSDQLLDQRQSLLRQLLSLDHQLQSYLEARKLNMSQDQMAHLQETLNSIEDSNKQLEKKIEEDNLKYENMQNVQNIKQSMNELQQYNKILQNQIEQINGSMNSSQLRVQLKQENDKLMQLYQQHQQLSQQLS